MTHHECKYSEDIGDMKSAINSIKQIGGWTLKFVIGEVVAVIIALVAFIYSWCYISITVDRHETQIMALQNKCSQCENVADAKPDNKYHANGDFFDDYYVTNPNQKE